MRNSIPNARLRQSLSSVQKECEVKIKTVVRIRPLLKKEKNDTIVLEERNISESSGDGVVVLKSLKSSPDGMNPESTLCNGSAEFHFNHVLPESTSQDKVYYTLGLPVVTATMNSLKKQTKDGRMYKSHLLISTGVENSGKTYTCFGGTPIPKRRAAQDGLVPRILDSLFSQSNHAGDSSKAFTVQISILQVSHMKGGQNNDKESGQIHDLIADATTSSKNKIFSASPKKKKNLNVRNMAARFERALPSPKGRKIQKIPDSKAVLDVENLKPTTKNCRDILEAREVLQNALSTSQKLSSGSENQKTHMYITMQPVVDGVKHGDKICVLDMSGLEEENMIRGIRGKETIASNTNPEYSAILNCLQALKHNSNIMNSTSSSSSQKLKPVPFRHHMITKLLNPLFIQSSFVETTVLIAAYPGHADFQQKTNLLKEIESLNSFDPGMSKKEITRRDAKNQQLKSRTSDQNEISNSVMNSTEQEKASLVNFKENRPKVEPSAPMHPNDSQLFMDSKKLKECMVDFPGVSIAQNDDNVGDAENRSMKEIPSVLATSTRPQRNQKEGLNGSKREKRSSLPEGRFVRKSIEANRKKELKNPLSRSHLENCEHFEHTGPNKMGLDPNNSDYRRTVEGKDDGNVKKLEKKLKEMLQEKAALEQKCSHLEKENTKLKRNSFKGGRKTSQNEVTQTEEEEFLASRKLRLEAQNKIKAPIHEHLARVNYIYEIKNQWCMTNKKHFSLSIPDHFQRAPVLDMRDRENDYRRDDLKNLTGIETQNNYDVKNEKMGSGKGRKTLTPTQAHLNTNKRSPVPEGLSALRKLAGKTLNN